MRRSPVLTSTVLLMTASCGLLPAAPNLGLPEAVQQPPPTFRAAPTLPPAWTPTPTKIPSPTPSATPSPTSPALASLPKGGFLLQELPPGFEELPLASLGVTAQQLSVPEVGTDSVTAYLHEEDGTLVISVVAVLETQAEQEAFDPLLDTPRRALDLLAAALGGTVSSDVQALDGFNPIGDQSTAVTQVIGLDDVPTRIDLAVFREGVIGAYLYLVYPEAGTQTLTLESAAGSLASILGQTQED
jgi:hypothetical protein